MTRVSAVRTASVAPLECAASRCDVRGRPRIPHAGSGALALLVLLSPAVAAAGDAATQSVGAGVEYSRVHVGDRELHWRSRVLQWERRSEGSGQFALLEQRERDHASDRVLQAGAFRVWRHWTLAGQLEAGSGAGFAPRRAAEAHLGFRVRPDAVVRLGHRHASYPASTLRLWALSGLHYRGDAEWELGLRRGSSGTPRQRIAFGLARGQWTCGARISCGARLSAGRNVFGADEVGFDTGTGWIGGVHAEYRFDGGHRLRLDLGTGRGDRFRQDTIGLSYRHALGS